MKIFSYKQKSSDSASVISLAMTDCNQEVFHNLNTKYFNRYCTILDHINFLNEMCAELV